MKRTSTIFIAAVLSLTAAAQNRFEAAAKKATIIFEQSEIHKSMLYHIEQELNHYAVHLSPRKYATATADYLIDKGFSVPQVIIYTATDSAVIVIYVPKRGTKNAEEVKEKIRKVLEPWNPEN